MRILVLQESDWIERGPHQSHHLLERMANRGHEVRIIDFEIGWRDTYQIGITTPRRAFAAPPKVIHGSTIMVVRPAGLRLPILDYAFSILTHGQEIRRQIREFRPDVVLGFGLLNASAGIRLAWKAEIPFVYYLIDELHRLVPQRAFRGLARIVEQANVRRASLVLTINRALRDYAIAMGSPSDRSLVLPAGVDLERYGSIGDGTDLRGRHGFERTDLILFFMGWVYPFSGLREVAEKIAAGEGREARAKLLVVGKGDDWTSLARISEDGAAEDRVKLVDFRPYSEMPSYLAAADICLLPAHDVPTMRNIVPIKMYEYLAAGRPVIATKLPGLMKEFGEGHGVVYVDRPEQVVDKALELARGGSLRELGQAGRAFVAKNDWEHITDVFEARLRELQPNKFEP